MEDETMCGQSKEALFLEKNYREGQVFKRVDCLNYDIGYSIYTGKYRENISGIVMEFYDGKEVLESFCTLISHDCADVLWTVTKEIERIEQQTALKIQNILIEYEKIK